MKLFISYSRDDKAWVYELWRGLRDEGHEAWIDQRIVPAADWWETILTQIEAAECFIYVMTDKAVKSIYCQAELIYAEALNKPILPISLKPCDVPAIIQHRRFQYLTINDGMTLDRVLLKIEQSLAKITVDTLNGKYAPRSAPRPDVPKLKDSAGAYEVYVLAVEAEAGGNLLLAEEKYEQVIKADPNGLGVAAEERLEEIRFERERANAWENILQLAANPIWVKGASAALRAFIMRYGVDDQTVVLEGQLTQLLQKPTPPLAPPPVQGGESVGAHHDAPAPNINNMNVGGSPRGGSRTAPTGETLRKWNATTRKIFLGNDTLFEWCPIPAGQVTLEKKDGFYGGGQTFDVPAVAIAKYPVTNAQFAVFMKAGGYRQKSWWTPDGWAQLEKDHWTEPRQWRDAKFNGREQPVMGVSWYEAMAFCQWLSETSSEQVILPTEEQWQRAAQGDDGRLYPWGNEFDKTCCNTYESSIRKTTPVMQYPQGASPYGVLDMSGNVWEWCLTEYSSDDNRNMNILRGGSWNNESSFARSVSRAYFDPKGRFNYFGFRVLCVFGLETGKGV